MQNIEIIGLIAASLTTGSFVPQVIKVWKYRSAKDISLIMYIAFLTGIVLWLYYGVVIDSISIILSNIVTFILAALILVAKIKYK